MMQNVLMSHGIMLFARYLTIIGMTVLNHCSFTALVFRYPCIMLSMRKLLFWKKMLFSENVVLNKIMLAKCSKRAFCFG